MGKPNYVALETDKGELIAFVSDDEAIIKDGYVYIEGYGEPRFVDVDGKPQLMRDDPVEEVEAKGWSDASLHH